jgi:hypothetical protein
MSLGAILIGADPLRIVELPGGGRVEVDLRSRTELSPLLRITHG